MLAEKDFAWYLKNMSPATKLHAFEYLSAVGWHI